MIARNLARKLAFFFFFFCFFVADVPWWISRRGSFVVLDRSRVSQTRANKISRNIMENSRKRNQPRVGSAAINQKQIPAAAHFDLAELDFSLKRFCIICPAVLIFYSRRRGISCVWKSSRDFKQNWRSKSSELLRAFYHRDTGVILLITLSVCIQRADFLVNLSKSKRISEQEEFIEYLLN